MFYYGKYAAIIGDIIDSKKLEDRRTIQQKFKNVLSGINEKYSEDIASKFRITFGDAFQGLLKNKRNIMKIITDIEIGMAPVKLRFGIGIGDINTDINFEDSEEIDGPAYNRAREVIEKIKKLESQYAQRVSSIMICSDDENSEIDELLNSILSVCTALKSKWTSRQEEIIYAYLANKENQYKAADVLNIGQSSVNKALKASRFYTYKSAIDTVNSFLSKERGS